MSLPTSPDFFPCSVINVFKVHTQCNVDKRNTNQLEQFKKKEPAGAQSINAESIYRHQLLCPNPCLTFVENLFKVMSQANLDFSTHPTCANIQHRQRN